jgi:hypothetical protein
MYTDYPFDSAFIEHMLEATAEEMIKHHDALSSIQDCMDGIIWMKARNVLNYTTAYKRLQTRMDTIQNELALVECRFDTLQSMLSMMINQPHELTKPASMYLQSV